MDAHQSRIACVAFFHSRIHVPDALRSWDGSHRKVSSACRKQSTFQLSWKSAANPISGTRLALAAVCPKRPGVPALRPLVVNTGTLSKTPQTYCTATLQVQLCGVPESQARTHELGTGASQTSAHACVDRQDDPLRRPYTGRYTPSVSASFPSSGFLLYSCLTHQTFVSAFFRLPPSVCNGARLAGTAVFHSLH